MHGYIELRYVIIMNDTAKVSVKGDEIEGLTIVKGMECFLK